METAHHTSPDKNNKTVVYLLITALVLLTAFVVWFILTQQTPVPPYRQKNTTTTTKVATSSAAATDDLTLIKKAMVIKTGIAEDKIAVTITKQEGNFAKGSVGLKGEATGGGYYLATKVDGTWVGVYSGQATPECALVNPFSFPSSFVPECLNANGAVVAR